MVVGLWPTSAAIWRILLPRLVRTWIVLRSICLNILSPRRSTGFYIGSGALYHFYLGVPRVPVHFYVRAYRVSACSTPTPTVRAHPMAQCCEYARLRSWA